MKKQNNKGSDITSHLIWIGVFNVIAFGLWYLIWAARRIYKNSKAFEHNRIAGKDEMEYAPHTWNQFKNENNIK